MRKSFAVVLLAVMTLFAFAACNNNPSGIILPPFFWDDSTPYDVSSPEDFTEMLAASKQVRLTDDITLSSLSFADNSSYSIDLNDHKLVLDIPETLSISGNSDVEIKNGSFSVSIPAAAPAKAFIELAANAKLTLENVDYSAAQTGLLVAQSAAELNIINSTITGGNGYAIGTNASETVEGVKINITGSHIYSTNGPALLFNIPSSLFIKDTYIEGASQAVIVRTGTATIENCKLVTNGNDDPASYDQYEENGNWGQGNMVPYATLVIGNAKGTGYAFETYCNVDEYTTIEMLAPDYPRVYAACANDKAVYISIPDEYAKEIENGNFYGSDYIFINGSETPLKMNPGI